MAQPIPYSQFVASILAIYDGPGHSPRTLTKMRHALGLLGSLTGVETTADLSTETIATFVRERSAQVCANTVRGDLAYLSAAASYAVEEGWLDHPPRWRRIRPRRSPPAGPQLHSIADVRRVLHHLAAGSESWTGHRLYAIASVAAYAALRRDEILQLMVQDIDLAAGLLRVVERRRLKTEASAATVPIAPELGGIIAAWIPRCGSAWLFPGVRSRDHPWTGGANGERPCDRLRQAGEDIGIQGLTLNSLRHAWATWARRRWGLSAIQVQEVLRHTSPRTQAWYLEDEPDQAFRVRAVSQVSYRA
jgi:integrase